MLLLVWTCPLSWRDRYNKRVWGGEKLSMLSRVGISIMWPRTSPGWLQWQLQFTMGMLPKDTFLRTQGDSCCLGLRHLGEMVEKKYQGSWGKKIHEVLYHLFPGKSEGIYRLPHRKEHRLVTASELVLIKRLDQRAGPHLSIIPHKTIFLDCKKKDKFTNTCGSK